MLDASSSVTVAARLPAPYVHSDNRGLVLCNGPQCVYIQASQLRACAETFEIIAAEGRATRGQGGHVVGGYKAGADVVLYAGTQDELLSVTLTGADFDALRAAIAQRR
jgi:hypothetical protein